MLITTANGGLPAFPILQISSVKFINIRLLKKNENSVNN